MPHTHTFFSKTDILPVSGHGIGFIAGGDGVAAPVHGPWYDSTPAGDAPIPAESAYKMPSFGQYLFTPADTTEMGELFACTPAGTPPDWGDAKSAFWVVASLSLGAAMAMLN